MTHRPAFAQRATPRPVAGAQNARRAMTGPGAARHCRRAVAASLVAVVLATQSVAQPELTVPPCSTPVASADGLLEQAVAEGYDVVATNADLSAQTADRLQWILAEPYLVGDSGGESLDTIMSRAHRNALALPDIAPTARAAIRVVQSDRAVAILRWSLDENGNVSMKCSGALFLDDGVFAPPTSGRFGDFSTTPVETAIPGLDIVSERFQLDRAAIRAKLPKAIPPHYIMGVQMRYNLEVFQ
ncbi:hypothetical protein [Thiosulfatihalobacter marinus]|uniref:hypothetical protein n=1 Tax=Thiosulfatihalobacter marinus TaxID=2792481 RepID=UPI0018D72F95|nr:hypothetical protein [Thiosulfatihalobacter marinus]